MEVVGSSSAIVVSSSYSNGVESRILIGIVVSDGIPFFFFNSSLGLRVFGINHCFGRLDFSTALLVSNSTPENS